MDGFFLFSAKTQVYSMVKNALLWIVLLCSCSLPAQTFAVGHVQQTYTDAARANRAVPVEIYYPAQTAGESVPCAADTFPLIVFGHGFVMTWSAYQNVWEAFVEQGYIVALPTTEGSLSPVHTAFGADLAFLITAIQQDAAANSGFILYNHVGNASALMGHSMGGGSAFLAAAGNTVPTTLVTFAAANTNPSSIAAAVNVSLPALVIAGQNDCVAPPLQHQLPMYDSLASPCKAYVSINGGGHCYFAETNFNCSFGEGTCSPNPTITRLQQQDAAQDLTLLWLNYYLKANCAALNRFNDSIQLSQRITGNYTCGNTAPLIAVNGNHLQSTPALTYQWLLNGTVVAGATADTLLPLQSGNYSVVVTYANQSCPDTSNIINWTLQGVSVADDYTGIQLFPVPADEQLTVHLNAAFAERCVWSVTDMQNRPLFSESRLMAAGTNEFTIPLAELAEGMYLLRCERATGEVVLVRPLLVTHH